MGVALELPTAADTREFGRALAGVLRAGDLVLLTGPLGAGKTALAQGVGAGLGVRGEVTSPTFVIARVHRPDPARGGVLPLVHVDAYRLGGVLEVDDLDLDAELADSVTLVEWGGGLAERLSDAHLEVRLSRADDTEVRRVELVPAGGDWSERIAGLAT
jgi:tRNA threonylcarbamoyladenosine biosynthesis protein TsaE